MALAPVYQVGMDNQPWLVLLNRKIVAAQDAAARLEARKALLGLIALKIGSTASYSPSFLIFSSPAQANTLSFQIRRTTGAPMFAGSAQITTGAITFSLRSLKRPGAYAVDVAGTITEGRLEITRALRSAVLNPKREPSRRVPSVSLS